MTKEKQRSLYRAIMVLSGFLLWTVLIRCVDVEAIGPQGSTVGFSAVNQFVHQLTGVHMTLYTLTDWLGLVPLLFVMGFGVLGLVQWIRRKHIGNVDYDILVLGGFYILVLTVYLLFERIPVNYRPVLIEGRLEPSYPSSTTMLVMCVMPTGIMQLNTRIRNTVLKRCLSSAIVFFIAFMVIGRLISGVHWFTDIVGGAFCSTGFVMLYDALVSWKTG